MLTYQVTDASGVAATPVSRTVTVVAPPPDTAKSVDPNPQQPPVITLKGDVVDMLWLIDLQWEEPGYSATDFQGSNITDSVTINSTVDTTAAGTYILFYNVVGSFGVSVVTQNRTVVVMDPFAGLVDLPPLPSPVITLNGSNNMTVQLGSVWTDPGYTATDSRGNNITDNVIITGTVNTTKAGTYILSYGVTDASSTVATPVSRTVTVVAPEPVPIEHLPPADSQTNTQEQRVEQTYCRDMSIDQLIKTYNYDVIDNRNNTLDIIRGTIHDDLILASGSGDRIFGQAGDDCIIGGAGNDVIRGGAGDDWIMGLAGDYEIYGGYDNDTIRGQSGDDNIVCGAGTDHARGGAGQDISESCETVRGIEFILGG